MPVRPHIFSSQPEADLRVIRVFPVSQLHKRQVLPARRLAEILDLTHDDIIAATRHFLFPGKEKRLVDRPPEAVSPAAVEIFCRPPPQWRRVIHARSIYRPAEKSCRLGSPSRLQLFPPTRFE